MKDLLIIHSDNEIISVSEYSEGTAVATPYYWFVNTKQNAIVILTALGITDLSKLEEVEN